MLPPASNITMPSAVVSRIAARSTRRRRRRRPVAASQARARRAKVELAAACVGANISASAESPSHEIVVEQARFRRLCVLGRRLRRRDRHRGSGLRGAAGLRDAGFDIERVQLRRPLPAPAGRIAHALEKRRIGIKQAVEPVDQDAGWQCRSRAARECALVLGARGRLGPLQPLRDVVQSRLALLARRFGRGRSRWRRSATASPGVGVAIALSSSRSSRADNCRANSAKALFSTGVRAGDLRFADRSGIGTTFLGGLRLCPNRFAVKSRRSWRGRRFQRISTASHPVPRA